MRCLLIHSNDVIRIVAVLNTFSSTLTCALTTLDSNDFIQFFQQFCNKTISCYLKQHFHFIWFHKRYRKSVENDWKRLENRNAPIVGHPTGTKQAIGLFLLISWIQWILTRDQFYYCHLNFFIMVYFSSRLKKKRIYFDCVCVWILYHRIIL